MENAEWVCEELEFFLNLVQPGRGVAEDIEWVRYILSKWERYGPQSTQPAPSTEEKI